jgi:hypothetical protein
MRRGSVRTIRISRPQLGHLGAWCTFLGTDVYVVQEKRASYKYDRYVVIGAELPSSGVTYYDVPAEYGVKNYRYTVVNDRTVLVDPGSYRIVQVIE